MLSGATLTGCSCPQSPTEGATTFNDVSQQRGKETSKMAAGQLAS